MSLNPAKSSFDNKPRVNPKVGKHVVRNFGVIDIGTQMESFEGKPPKPTPKVILMFEFPKVLHVFDEKVGPEPLQVFSEYSFIASDRSKLCKVLKAWGRLEMSPKQLNLKPYLGKYCEVEIEHKPKRDDPSIIYSNIADNGRSVFPVTESIDDPQQEGKVIQLIDPATRIPYGCKAYNANVWFDMDNFTWEQFKSLPKFIQDKIRKSREFPEKVATHGAEPASETPTTSHSQAQNYEKPVASVPSDTKPIVTAADDDMPSF
ncbi:MAG: hypothetical protein IT212_07435 [Bacteroidia bacterium]|nr:hypothetical protein [Bacteroidia bacterium]